MSVNLQNAYVEVLLNNFMEVVKQNIMFQAELEVSKKELEEVPTMKRNLQEIANSNIELQKRVGNINEDIQKQVNDSKAETQKQIAEKNRLQSAINGYMQSNQKIENENTALKDKVEELTKYVETLKTMISVTENKKIKAEKKTQPKEQIPSEVTIEDNSVKSGGSF